MSQLDFAPYIKPGKKKLRAVGLLQSFTVYCKYFGRTLFVLNLNRQTFFCIRGGGGGEKEWGMVLSQEDLFSSGEISPRLLY